MFEKISFWPWIIARSCSFKIAEVIVDLTIIGFVKDRNCHMRGKLIIEDFVH